MTKVHDAVAAQKLAPHPIAAWRWGIIWLMFLATLINYMDRQTLGSTARYLKEELQLSEEGYGWIEFWFIVGYALFQIPAGYLADRLNLRWLYAVALLAWSAAGFLTGWAETVLLMSACRFVLGMSEAFNWPCAVGIVRRVIPLESRGLANGIFHSGASAGAVLTPLLVLMVVGAQGQHWRLVFQLVGGLGLVWAILWFAIVRGPHAAEISQAPQPHGNGPEERTSPIARLLTSRQFWIALSVGITVNVCWHFYRVWLPRYLDVSLKLTLNEIQLVLIGFYIAADLGSVGAGWLTRRLAEVGYSVERSRKIVLLGAALLCLLSTPAALCNQTELTLPLLFIVAVGAMGGFPIYFALNQEAAPEGPALCLGITGSISLLTIAALTPPIGQLVDRSGTFAPSLIAVGCVPLIGASISFLWPEPDSC